MRKTKSLTASNIIGVIPKGGKITILSVEGGNWYQVKFGRYIGYVKGGYFSKKKA